MSSSWNSWAGKICQKFEDVCLDVEGVITKERFEYVQTQIQSAGANVGQFCSNIMDTVLDLDISSVDSADEEDEVDAGPSLASSTESPSCETSKGGAVDSCLGQNSTTEGAVDSSSLEHTKSSPSENSIVERFADPSLVRNTGFQPCENSTMEGAVDMSIEHYLKSQPTKSDNSEEEQLNTDRSDDITRENYKASVKPQMENRPLIEEYCNPQDMELDPETKASIVQQREDIQSLIDYCFAMEKANTKATVKQLEERLLLNESFIFAEGYEDNSELHEREKHESSNSDDDYSDSEWEFV